MAPQLRVHQYVEVTVGFADAGGNRIIPESVRWTSADEEVLSLRKGVDDLTPPDSSTAVIWPEGKVGTSRVTAVESENGADVTDNISVGAGLPVTGSFVFGEVKDKPV